MHEIRSTVLVAEGDVHVFNLVVLLKHRARAPGRR
jgi:hypothetical protein